MKINFYHWKKMPPAQKARFLARSQQDLSKFIAAVKPIIEDVRVNGDPALVAYEKKFNGVTLNKNSIKVTKAEMNSAWKSTPVDIKKTIEYCAKNVRKHNVAALKAYRGFTTETEKGVISGERAYPVSSVGLYVPGAKNTFPSTVYMLGVPANVAGVEKIAMITQARANGTINPVTLAAAQIAGVKTIYKISGAHGIAALALGTKTVDPVDKILGPGGLYAFAAKLLLPQYRMIDIGFPAGPSESVILCDQTANPKNTILDILNEAEHGPDSAGILVTHSKKIAEYARDHLPAAINALPEPQRGYCKSVMNGGYGAIILTESLEESIEVTNLYAPEHVMVKTRNPHAIVPKIKNAASILIGENTPGTLANFSLGSNHSLPTGGAGRVFSGASITEYLKFTQISEVKTTAAYKKVAVPAAHMARIEGFPAHENVVTKRR
jgi:histidinol dehydrogenase